MISKQSEIYKIRSYETDSEGCVKLSSVFDYMQESASNHADMLGFGYDFMQSNGLFWVLSRVKINLGTYPKTWESIIVETWPKNIHKLFANRDFKFYTTDGQQIGAATTSWLMVGKNNLRPVPPDKYLKDIHSLNTEPGIDEILEKIDEPESLSFVKSYDIGYKDIDLNKHTNNARYVELLLDCLYANEAGQKKISTLQINFLNQTKLGDIINLYKGNYGLNLESEYIEGKTANEVKILNSIAIKK